VPDKRRVAILGCGQRGRAHTAGFLADPRCEVVALADTDPAAAEALNTQFQLDAAIYQDHRKLLADEHPEVVALCLWTPLHLPVFRDCTDAGVRAVLSEKPMAPTWGECLEIAGLAERTGCQLTFCHQRRFAEGNLRARRMIQEGRFGRLLRMDLYSPPNLLDCGTHTFDQALSFNGETPARWVLGAVDATEPIHWFDVWAEAMAVGTVVFQNDVRATIQVGGPDVEFRSGVRVLGSDGFIEVTWNGEYRQTAVFRDPAWRPPAVKADPEAQMAAAVRDALDALEDGTEPELSFRKALRAGEIIFAFYESVRRHARVELPLERVTDNPFISMLESGAFGFRPPDEATEDQ